MLYTVSFLWWWWYMFSGFQTYKSYKTLVCEAIVFDLALFGLRYKWLRESQDPGAVIWYLPPNILAKHIVCLVHACVHSSSRVLDSSSLIYCITNGVCLFILLLYKLHNMLLMAMIVNAKIQSSRCWPYLEWAGKLPNIIEYHLRFFLVDYK